MVDWRIAEALAVDTRQAVTRWWTRCRSAAAPIPDGLVDDLQAARLALDDGLQRRFWGFASVLREPRRSEFVTKIGEVDPWHVLSEMAAGRTQPDPAAGDVLRRVTVRERLVVFRARPVFASYLSGSYTRLAQPLTSFLKRRPRRLYLRLQALRHPLDPRRPNITTS
jgi:hypothetical protein